MSEINGRLENWVVAPWGDESVVWGNLYDDTKERFDDGLYVHTSRVESICMLPNDRYVQTRNSRYRLGVQRDVDIKPEDVALKVT